MSETVRIDYGVGSLTVEEVKSILTGMPGQDYYFVDKDNIVRLSTILHDPNGRAEVIVGKHIDECHPEKAKPRLHEWLDRLRSGETDEIDSAFENDGRYIYNRFVAVRNKNGEYLGCLQLIQDVTHVIDHWGINK
jgi:DUF438 domain-containing protein